MTGKCPLCGATARLGPDGTCAYRGGCEHRQLVAEATERKIDAGVERLDELVGGAARAIIAGGIVPAEALNPYDRDVRAWMLHVRQVHGERACLHCALQQN